MKTLGELGGAVCAEERDQLGRDHDNALALALRLSEDDAAALALRAVLRMTGAGLPAGRLRADVRALPAVLRATRAMAVLGAIRRTGQPVPVLTAPVRVGAAVAPGVALELPPHLDRPLVEVDVLPPQAERLALAQSERQADGPADAVAAALGGAEDSACLVLGEGFDLDFADGGSVDQRGDVPSDLPAAVRDLEHPGQDPVRLEDAPRRLPGGGHGGGKAMSGGHRGGSHAYRGGRGSSHAYKGRSYAHHDGGKHHKGKNYSHYNKGHYRYGRYYRNYRNYGWYGAGLAYGYGGCAWLRQQALITGSPYWWQRYNSCIY